MYTVEPDPNTPLGRLQLRAKRVPLWVRIPAIVFAFAVTIVVIVLDLPPYSLLVSGQAAAFDGQHYPVVSIGLTMVCFLVPIGIGLQLIAGFFPDNRPPDPFGQVAPPVGGPPPAYMQSGPYAQPLYGAPPQGQAPYGQGPTGQAPFGPTGQAPFGQGPTGQGPYGQGPFGQGPTGQGPTGQGPFGGQPPG